MGSVRPITKPTRGGYFLRLSECGNEGKSAAGTFSKASGFTVLQEAVSNKVVVDDRDTAHRLHADDEHRICVTALRKLAWYTQAL